MTTTLAKLQPLHPELVPPQGAQPFGVTADGKHQLYKLVTRRSRSVPKLSVKADALLKDARANLTGDDLAAAEALIVKEHQEFRKHATTGEPMYGLRQPEIYDNTEIFYLESQGNGNVVKVPYKFPTPEELAAVDRARRVEAMKDTMAEALVDAGVTPETLVQRLSQIKEPVMAPAAVAGGQVTPPAADDVPPVDLSKYPEDLGGGYWRFSNGDKAQMKKDAARETEDRLQAARKAAAETPEE